MKSAVLLVLLCLAFSANSSLEEDLLSLSLEELGNIEVTVGTRGHGRKVRVSPVPIQIITAQQLAQTGFGETARALQRLIPSFGLSYASNYDSEDHVRAFSLRGLSVDQVLVLVNGKRLHSSALVHPYSNLGQGATGVDINTIPLNAIKRVEVLKDGAAAQYGSDAIAGIINFVLKDEITNQLSTTLGQTTEGDGELKRVTFNTGINFLNPKSFLLLAGEFRNRNNTNRAQVDNRQNYFDGDPRNDDAALNDKVNAIYGDPDSQDVLLNYNGQIALNTTSTVYSFGNVNYRDSTSTGFFRLAKEDRNVRAIYPDGYLPMINPKITDLFSTVGMRLKGSDWGLDFSNSVGLNKIDLNVENSLNASYGIESQRSFDVGSLKTFQYLGNLDWQRDWRGAWKEPLSIALGLEFRWERFQVIAGEPSSYDDGGVPILDGDSAGMAAPVGAQVLPGLTPKNATNENRYNMSTYLDLEKKLSDKWLGQLAFRYEYYEDFGSNFNGKIASSYRMNDRWVLRCSTSTGFRAPSLAQSFYTSTTTDVLLDEFYEFAQLSVDDPVARALGAKDLKPEKSVHASVGSSLTVNDNLYFEMDLFWNQIKDRIALSDTILQEESIYGATVADILNDAGLFGVRFQTNAIDTKMSGVDLSVNTQWWLKKDYQLDLSLDYYYNNVKKDGNARDLELLGDQSQNIVFNRAKIVELEDSQQKDNVILTAQLLKNPYLVEVKAIRFGESEYVFDSQDPSFDQVHPPKWVFDLLFSYRPSDAMDLSFGVHNVFDEYPDYIMSEEQALAVFGDQDEVIFGPQGVYPYEANLRFDINGAFYYFKFNYKM